MSRKIGTVTLKSVEKHELTGKVKDIFFFALRDYGIRTRTFMENLVVPVVLIQEDKIKIIDFFNKKNRQYIVELITISP